MGRMKENFTVLEENGIDVLSILDHAETEEEKDAVQSVLMRYAIYLEEKRK